MNFPPCYLQSLSSNGFYSPHLPWIKIGLKLICNVNIVYGNLMSEKSRLCPETSNKLYFQEFGLSKFSNKSGTSKNTCLYIYNFHPTLQHFQKKRSYEVENREGTCQLPGTRSKNLIILIIE
jgi:hypothetical protein